MPNPIEASLNNPFVTIEFPLKHPESVHVYQIFQMDGPLQPHTNFVTMSHIEVRLLHSSMYILKHDVYQKFKLN